MSLDVSALFIFIVALVGVNCILIILLLIVKKNYKKSYRKQQEIRNLLIKHILHTHSQDTNRLSTFRRKDYFQVIKTIAETVTLPQPIRERVLAFLEQRGFQAFLIKKISSPFRFVRMRSVLGLSIFPGEETEKALLRQLEREKKYFIKLAIVNSLVELKNPSAIRPIVTSLGDAPQWYREKAIELLQGMGIAFFLYVRDMITEGKADHIIQIALTTAAHYPSPELKQFLFQIIHTASSLYQERALQIIKKVYPRDLTTEEYLENPSPLIRAYAISALTVKPSQETFTKLISYLSNETVKDTAIVTLELLIAQKPQYLPLLTQQFSKENRTTAKEAIARILSNKIEYFLANILSDKKQVIKELIFELLRMGKLSSIIGFLNRNKNREIENELIPVLQKAIKTNESIRWNLSLYLKPRIRGKLGLSEAQKQDNKKRIPLTKKEKVLLIALFILALSLGPLLYIGIHFHHLSNLPLFSHLVQYVQDYNYYFAFYSAAINSIYIILLIFSGMNLFRQIRFWRIHNERFLFKDSILPSISILAPAYNEEKNIVENVYSLLNLKYPDFEVVIINDGSKDETLNKVITEFNLQRVDTDQSYSLHTAPVRGIFQNPSLPSLTVIDKENGGKADSLNAGINVARSEYICTIDADSLLESEALLKIMYQTLLSDKETLAVGGNVLPVNGCKVEKGEVTQINLSKEPLAKFQTIEYLRAFLAGRLGWAFINCLLIISGAFGVFKRDNVLSIGGYLTARGKYRHDTVGEDMEMVVRLHRQEKETRKKYTVPYAFNANCWTEVPTTMKTLYRQRDRWHRGLLEIASFHRKMFARPRYQQVGLISFPYFYIFEIVGPFFEFFGYLALALSAIFGLLNPSIALLLFITVILLGIVVSVSSLFISENEILYFSPKEVFTIISIAVLENFGFRQLMSMIRVFAYVSFLFKNKGWGEMQRTGFSGGTSQT